MNNPATLFWLLCGALGALGLALLNHFSDLPLTSSPGQLWIASGLVLLAYHSGRGGGTP